MIAIVTSCINPQEIPSATRSYFNVEDREKQTIKTLTQLKKAGFKQIILADNSLHYDFSRIAEFTEKIKIIQLRQYQFANKSINEILILLAVLNDIPENEQIFKISGRYFPNDDFKAEMSATVDFKVKGHDFENRRPTITTRGYFVRNKQIYEQFLLSCLNEIYSYPYRIVGRRTLVNFFKELFTPKPRTSSYISVEFAAGRVLKQGNFTYELTDQLNIEGQIAGLQTKEQINE